MGNAWRKLDIGLTLLAASFVIWRLTRMDAEQLDIVRALVRGNALGKRESPHDER